MQELLILRGNICYSTGKKQLESADRGYLVSRQGIVEGVYSSLPAQYEDAEITDWGNCLIIPGLTDLHVHAPQYAFRGLGMDLELLDWLNTHTFPEEAKYRDLEYAGKAYEMFVRDLKNGATTRAVVFGTIHEEATELLMDLLEESGLITMVGKVNMDRNSPDELREKSAGESLQSTRRWLGKIRDKYERTRPILTPRFIPSCTDELMSGLKEIQREYSLPVQSHLSENQGEVEWVRELCPWSDFYGDAYDHFGLFGGEYPAVMAHCVHSKEEEIRRMKQRGVYIAHCPQSNTNLSSGVAPVRTYLEQDMNIGLGSDVAGGFATSILRAMADAIQAAKLRWRRSDSSLKPLSFEEAFYLGTKGGGSFFGKVGSFEPGYEMDAVVLDDSQCPYPQELTVKERVERLIYLAGDSQIAGKYVAGKKIK